MKKLGLNHESFHDVIKKEGQAQEEIVWIKLTRSIKLQTASPWNTSLRLIYLFHFWTLLFSSSLHHHLSFKKNSKVITTAPGHPKKLQWYFNVLLLLLFFSEFWYELSGWACSLHAAFWLNRSSLLVLILEQQNSTNQKKTGQNGERIVRTFHVNIFSHLFRPKLLWKTNLKRIKSYRIYISSNSRPEQVTEVIFIKYLWEENSLFLYKLVNFFKTLRRNITGDFLDGPVLLCSHSGLPNIKGGGKY